MKIKGEDRIEIVANAMKGMTYYEQIMLAEMLSDTINDASGKSLLVDNVADALHGWARGYNAEA